MGLENLDDIKTRRTEQEKNETAEILRGIASSSQTKDVRSETIIGYYRTGGTDHHYGRLSISNKGFTEVEGYHEHSEDYLDGSYEDSPRKVGSEDFKEIVKKYSISKKDAENLRDKLSGK
jgi:hypothetical protein